MGSGCSSPLKRFGARRTHKSSHRDSSGSLEPEAHQTDGQPDGSSAGAHLEQPRNQPASREDLFASAHKLSASQHKRHAPDNEITIQSEINDDHPSSASYNTDCKNQNEETKNSELSSSIELKGSSTNTATNNVGPVSGAVARMIGLNGTHVALDRHLLVSPALSPAPSTCYSPSPAGSAVGSLGLDFSELTEAFRLLTLGTHVCEQSKGGGGTGSSTTSTSGSYSSKDMLQSQSDLVKYISVFLIMAPDCYQVNTSIHSKHSDNINKSQVSCLETLVKQIESSLRRFCDEISYTLRFLNLTHSYMSEHFHINNLLDASIKLLEQENHLNGQRTVVIVISNISHAIGSFDQRANQLKQTSLNDSVKSSTYRQLPTRIEAQTMQKFLQSLHSYQDTTSNAEELIKRWYNQAGNMFYLNPIYLVEPSTLADSDTDRKRAWNSWNEDLCSILNLFNKFLEDNPNLNRDLRIRTLFDAHLEFIINDISLQKRSLLIRAAQPANSGSASNNATYTKDENLNELVRLLADSNKLTIKQTLSADQFIKDSADWLLDNFSKIMENITENQIAYGKHIPTFIERKLFIELTQQREQLEYYLINTTESHASRCQTFYSTQISPLLESIKNAMPLSNSNSLTANLNQESPVPVSTNHLIFISGPKGCGKSTLLANIIKYAAQDLLNRAHIIYRFCGVSVDSFSSNRIMRSICEQFCQNQGENTTAASYIYSARKDVINALNRIIKTQSSIIFLDGLDQLCKNDVKSNDLNWLCELKASPRLKIFIILETDSDLYKKALSTYNDATYITLDYPSIGEWAQMLASSARSRRLNSTANLYEEIKKADSSDSNEIKPTYNDVSDILHVCRMRQLNNEFFFPELNPKTNLGIIRTGSIHGAIISQLQYLLKPYQVCALLVAIDSSRYGLIETDIVNIMTMISESQRPRSPPEQIFSSTMLSYLKLMLQPWLVSIICDKSVKLTLKQDFLVKLKLYFIDNLYPKIENEVREILIDYFSRKTRCNSVTSKPSINLKGNNVIVSQEPRTNVSYSESSWLATQASELAHLLTLTNPSKARDFITEKNQFFIQFLYSSMPEEFIEDCEKLRTSSVKKSVISNEDLNCLLNFINQSVYPLKYDGAQIYSQILCRAYEINKANKSSRGKRLTEIITTAMSPPIASLMPISETSTHSFIKAKIGQQNPQQSFSNGPTSSALATPNATMINQKQGKPASNQTGAGPQTRQKIFTIKDNHKHVIVIHPDRGSLAVWNIYEERPVRIINNLDQPRDLRMIDQKRAVVLCNRELKVYDLNSGDMLTKLKGELETTFKVGEDRFLNSLLVSEDGGICVCGDETQKPFPLLVWNLNERRLLYDLRLDKHEFITKMSAISDDGHFVVSVCRQLGDNDALPHGSLIGSEHQGGSQSKSSPNFIVIYDLSSGTLFKKWKPGLDSCAVAICLPANRSGKVINTIADSSILVWDLSTGSKRHTLVGHSAPADIIRVQNERLFSMDSSCRDQSLRIWDIEEGCCLTVFTPDAPVNCCQISIRGDALICGFACETRLSTLLECKGESVSDILKREEEAF